MKKLLAPNRSLDPAEWSMYCDLLQDAGEPEEKWTRARHIAESLAVDPKLVLINYCPARPLEGHWLRVGRTWFIGADGTFIENNRLVWWRAAWVRAGFERYPSRDPDRDVSRLIGLNHGVPWDLPHPRFELVKTARRYSRLRQAFFDAHALTEIPTRYL